MSIPNTFTPLGDAVRRVLAGLAKPHGDLDGDQEHARLREHVTGAPQGDRCQGRGERSASQEVLCIGPWVGSDRWQEGRGSLPRRRPDGGGLNFNRGLAWYAREALTLSILTALVFVVARWTGFL